MPDAASPEAPKPEDLFDKAVELIGKSREKLHKTPEFRLALLENPEEAFFQGRVKFTRKELKYDVIVWENILEKYPANFWITRGPQSRDLDWQNDPKTERVKINSEKSSIVYEKGRIYDDSKPVVGASAVPLIEQFLESI